MGPRRGRAQPHLGGGRGGGVLGFKEPQGLELRHSFLLPESPHGCRLCVRFCWPEDDVSDTCELRALPSA